MLGTVIYFPLNALLLLSNNIMKKPQLDTNDSKFLVRKIVYARGWIFKWYQKVKRSNYSVPAAGPGLLPVCDVFSWMKQTHPVVGDGLESVRWKVFLYLQGPGRLRKSWERMVLSQGDAVSEMLSNSAMLDGRSVLGKWLRVCVTKLTYHWSELCHITTAS